MKLCSFEGCDRKSYSLSLCHSHYNQQYLGRELTPLRKRAQSYATPEQILDTWLDKNGECWLWLGDTWNGYGKTAYKGKRMYAHRLAYSTWVGDIDETMVIHHKCSTRTCCNPDHLQLTTHHDNTAEMFARRAYEAEIKQLKEENKRLKARIKNLEKKLDVGT